MTSTSFGRTGNAAKAQALVTILRELDLPHVTSQDVEWMYGYPEAVTFLDAIENAFRGCAAQCVVSNSEALSRAVLPQSVSKSVLAVLRDDENDHTQATVESLHRAERSARENVTALQHQVTIMEQLAAQKQAARTAHASRDRCSQNSSAFRALSFDGAEDEAQSISNFRSAVASLSQISARVCEIADSDARNLLRRISAYKKAELRLQEQVIASARAAWTLGIQSDRKKLADSKPGIAHAPIRQQTERDIIPIIADAVGASEEQICCARVYLSRALSLYQALRHYRQHSMAVQNDISLERLQEDVERIHSSWQQLLANSVNPEIRRRGREKVLGRAELFHMQVRVQRQKKRTSHGQHWLQIATAQHARVALLRVLLRFRQDRVEHTCTAVAKYIQEPASRCLLTQDAHMSTYFQKSKLVTENSHDLNYNSETKSFGGNDVNQLEVSPAKNVHRDETETYQKIAAFLDRFRARTGSKSEWLQVQKSARMTTVLRDLRCELNTATNSLHLLLQERSKKIEDVKSQMTDPRHGPRWLWITFHGSDIEQNDARRSFT